MAESQRSGLFVFRGNEDDIVLAFVGTDSWLASFGVVGERCVLKRCDGDVGLSVISNLVSDLPSRSGSVLGVGFIRSDTQKLN